MDENADASQAILERPPENWRRPPGRPRTTWMKNIHDDLSSLYLGIHEARDLASVLYTWWPAVLLAHPVRACVCVVYTGWHAVIAPVLLAWLLNGLLAVAVLVSLFTFGEPVTKPASAASVSYWRHRSQADQYLRRASTSPHTHSKHSSFFVDKHRLHKLHLLSLYKTALYNQSTEILF